MMAQNVFSDITGEMFAMTALNVLLSLFFIIVSVHFCS